MFMKVRLMLGWLGLRKAVLLEKTHQGDWQTWWHSVDWVAVNKPSLKYLQTMQLLREIIFGVGRGATGGLFCFQRPGFLLRLSQKEDHFIHSSENLTSATYFSFGQYLHLNLNFHLYGECFQVYVVRPEPFTAFSFMLICQPFILYLHIYACYEYLYLPVDTAIA